MLNQTLENLERVPRMFRAVLSTRLCGSRPGLLPHRVHRDRQEQISPRHDVGRRLGWFVAVAGTMLALIGCAPHISMTIPTAVKATVTDTSAVRAATPTPPVVEVREIRPALLQGKYLANPGIGWQADGDVSSPVDLPETVAYADRRTISWRTLNPAKGEYDWSALDAELDQATAAGEQFSFRVYSMAGQLSGGQRMPQWVLKEGVALTPSGEPDYSNCVYQQRWGEFVDALVQRYDGNPNIAFIDISGYGDFNEWSWQDQTQWDEEWKNAYQNGSPDPAAFKTLDGQARRRLADMFIGGSFSQHACRDGHGRTSLVDYAYPGFRQTQLVMPFAGINQSTQYVHWRRSDVGFRYDCLGRSADDRLVLDAARNAWQRAPVVFELCSQEQFSMASALTVLQRTHGSLVHDNGHNQDVEKLRALLSNVGYRYALRSASLAESPRAGGQLSLSMIWQNLGWAPSYPGMGQNFQLHLLLVDASGQQAPIDEIVPVDIAAWMPAEDLLQSPPENKVDFTLSLPTRLRTGAYELKVAIIDQRTGRPIQLAFEGVDANGRYLIDTIQINQ